MDIGYYNYHTMLRIIIMDNLKSYSQTSFSRFVNPILCLRLPDEALLLLTSNLCFAVIVAAMSVCSLVIIQYQLSVKLNVYQKRGEVHNREEGEIG